MQHNRHHMQKNGYASFSYTQPFEKRAEPGKYLPEASDRYRAIRQRKIKKFLTKTKAFDKI